MWTGPQIKPATETDPPQIVTCDLSIYLSAHRSISLIRSSHGPFGSLVLRHPRCTRSARRQLTLMDGDGLGPPVRPMNQLTPCHNQRPPPSPSLPPPRVHTSVRLADVPLTAWPAGEGGTCRAEKAELMMNLGDQSMSFHTPWH